MKLFLRSFVLMLVTLLLINVSLFGQVYFLNEDFSSATISASLGSRLNTGVRVQNIDDFPIKKSNYQTSYIPINLVDSFSNQINNEDNVSGYRFHKSSIESKMHLEIAPPQIFKAFVGDNYVFINYKLSDEIYHSLNWTIEYSIDGGAIWKADGENFSNHYYKIPFLESCKFYNVRIRVVLDTVTSPSSNEISFNTRLSSSETPSWKSATSPNNNWTSIAYGNGLFVAVSESGSGNRVMTSDDGINWISRVSPANNNWYSVTYGNGLFVATSWTGNGDRVMTSPDGINWTLRSTPVNNMWTSVVYGNGLFVAVSTNGSGNRVMTSPDGINWTSRTTPVDNNWFSVTYGNGMFVAVSVNGNGNQIMTSPDGINWTVRATPLNRYWFSVTYGNGLFVAVANNGTLDAIMTSSDGINWSIKNAPVNANWFDVEYGDGRFVAVAEVGNSSRIMYSYDGEIWIKDEAPYSQMWNSIVYGENKFVATSYTGANQIMYFDWNNAPLAPEVKDYKVSANSINVDLKIRKEDLIADSTFLEYKLSENTNWIKTVSIDSIQTLNLNNLIPDKQYAIKFRVSNNYGTSCETQDLLITTNCLTDSSFSSFNPFPDTLSVINQNSLVLNAGSGYQAYQWWHGGNEPVTTIRESGQYIVRVYNELGCYKSDTTNVVFIDFSIQKLIDKAPKIWASFENIIVQKENGDFYGWGRNAFGQFGIGTRGEMASEPIKLPNSQGWIEFATSRTHTLAVAKNGSLWAWGSNDDGQLGTGNRFLNYSPIQINSDSTWVAVSAGQGYSMAIKSDGSLWGWGRNIYGQLGTGTTITQLSPIKIGSDNDWKSVFSTFGTTYAIKKDGTLWGWGWNENGLVGNGNQVDQLLPVRIGTDSGWVNIAINSIGSSYHRVGLKSDGTIWVWGLNNKGQLGLSDTSQITSPVKLELNAIFKSIAIGREHSLALDNEGSVWVWGSNEVGQLSLPSNQRITHPIKLLSDKKYLNVYAGFNYSLFLTYTKELFFSGSIGLSRQTFLLNQNLLNNQQPISLNTEDKWEKIQYNGEIIAGINSKKELKLWGRICCLFYDSLITNNFKPLKLTIDTSWSNISLSHNHILALTESGTLYSWGNNDYGQLGNGTLTSSSSPQKIGLDSEWKSVFSYDSYSFAIKKDGTLWSWGNNNSGQLGHGDIISSSIPKQVGFDIGWSKLILQETWAGGIKDGKVFYWGFEIGSNSPIQLGADSNWIDIDGTQASLHLINKDSSLWGYSWFNNYGSLGDSTITNNNILKNITSDIAWTSLSGGQLYTKAIKKDKSIWFWGYGFPSNRSQLFPANFSSIKDWKYIQTDKLINRSIGLLSDGTPFVWGNILSNLSNELKEDYFERTKIPIDLIGNRDTSFKCIDDSVIISTNSLYDLKYIWSTGDTTDYIKVKPSQTTSYKVKAFSGSQSFEKSITVYVNPKNFNPFPDTLSVCADSTRLDAGGNYNSYLWYHGGGEKDAVVYKSGLYTVRVYDENNCYQEDSVRVSLMNPKILIAKNTENIRLATGLNHLFVIKSDNTLWAWGDNTRGQLGNGSKTSSTKPIQIGKDADWKEIATSETHTLAIKKDGSLWGWGDNSNGQLGSLVQSEVLIPTRVDTNSQWTNVSVGSFYSLALKNNGSIWSSGRNTSGQLGISSQVNSREFTLVGIENTWKYVKAGPTSSYAIKQDNSLWVWGNNSSGQLGIGDKINRLSPTRLGNDNNWASIDSKYLGTPTAQVVGMKTDSTIWSWGKSGYFPNTSELVEKLLPEKIILPISVNSFSAGQFHIIILANNGEVWGLGGSTTFAGQLGKDTVGGLYTPQKLNFFNDIINVAAGRTFSVVISNTGEIIIFGDNTNGQIGSGESIVLGSPRVIEPEFKWKEILFAGGNGSSLLGIKKDNTLWAWGRNFEGNTSVGGILPIYSPIQISNFSNFKKISSGFSTLLIDQYAQLWQWNFRNNYIPALVNSDKDWKDVSTSNSGHTLALKNDGTLWSFGVNNAGGEQGNGTYNSSEIPLKISDQANWNYISAGEQFSLAKKTTDSLFAWGYIPLYNMETLSPLSINTSPKWNLIKGNYAAFTGISKDSSLYSWGFNKFGTVGDGTFIDVPNPKKIDSSKWKDISIGGTQVVGIRSDSTLWSWGENGKNKPTLMSNVKDWSYINTTTNSSIAILSDGTAFYWGTDRLRKNGIEYTKELYGSRPYINIYNEMSDVTICKGQSFVLTSNLGSKFKQVWSTGDTTSSITVSPRETTTYTLTVTDGITTCTDQVTITVNQVDTSLTALDTTAICVGGSARLQAGTGTSYVWLKNGSVINGASSSLYSATSAGSYRVVVTNASGCSDTSAVITITERPVPVSGTISGAGVAVCSGTNSTAMTLTGSVGTIRWQSSLDSLVFTDIANATSSGYTATNLTSTTYYRVITTNSCGSDTSAIVKVLVNPKPVPSFTVNTASQVLTNNSFVFTNTSTGGSSYLWRFGNGATATTQNATYSYSATGSYVVRLIVTTAAGCRDSVSTTVTVTPPPPPPPAAGNLYVAGATCATFSNGSAGRLSQICYTIKAGTAPKGKPAPIQVSAVTPASFMYYVRVTAPSASFTVNIGQTVSQNGFRLFTVNTGSSQASGDNCVRVASVTTPSTGQARVSITRATVGRTYIIGVRYDTKSLVGYTTTGTISPVYTFSAKIGNLTLPNSTSSVTAYPNNCANAPAGIISSRMPDSKEINSTSNAPTKALSITTLKLKAYPNPTSHYFNVVVEGGDRNMDGIIRVTNTLGQLIEVKKQVRPGELIQVGQQYIGGMYMIEYTQGTNRAVLKVSKQ